MRLALTSPQVEEDCHVGRSPQNGSSTFLDDPDHLVKSDVHACPVRFHLADCDCAVDSPYASRADYDWRARAWVDALGWDV